MRRSERREQGAVEALLSVIAVIVCIATSIAVALDAGAAVRGPLGLIFICFVPGWTAAMVCRLREPLHEIGLVVGTSVASITVLGQVMLLFKEWHPVTATYVVAAACTILLASSIARAQRPRRARAATTAGNGELARMSREELCSALALELQRSAAPVTPVLVSAGAGGSASAQTGVVAIEPIAVIVDPVDLRDDRRRVRVERVRRRRMITFHVAVIAGAIALWAVSLAGAHPDVVSGIGLISAMPAAYFVALAVLAAGFAIAISARVVRERVLVLYTGALVLLLHGTTPILYPEPRYTWTYKHFGVIDYIAVHGRVDRSIDIYHSWPGFFAMNAWLSRVTGWAPIDYAAWAQPAFEAANVAALVFCLRGLTRDNRRIWVACWIFLLVNWLGQDYLAPQSFGFFLGLVVTGLVIRCANRRWLPTTGAGRRWTRAVDRLAALFHVDDLRDPRYEQPTRAAAAFILGAVCFLAVVVSHQLSPYIVIASVVALVALREARPVWLPFAMAAAAFLWLAEIGFAFVSRHFSLFSIGSQVRARPVGFTGARALPGVTLDDIGKFGVVLCLVLFAVIGTLLRARRRRTDVVVIALALAPGLVATVQSYDGEGWIRALLFALPWLAFLAAAAVTEPLRGPREGTTSSSWFFRMFAVSFVLLPMMLFAYFGQESVNYISKDDVAVNEWYLKNAPDGSVIGFVAANSPARLSARYADLIVGDVSTTLTDVVALRHNIVRDADAGTVARLLGQQKGTKKYLVSSPSEERYLEYYGIVPHGWVNQLLTALRRSPYFRVVYRSGSAEVFELR